MNLILERLLVVVAPLLAATTKGKRKPVKKPIKKPVKRVTKPARAKAKPVRAKKSANPAKGTRTKTSKKPVEPPKPTPNTVKQVVAEPQPKPLAPTGRAILLLPENDKFTDNVHPTFRWLSVGGAARYEIAWSEDAALSTSHSIFSIATEATVPVEKPLRLGGTYFWRVRGGNEGGWGPWSAIASFRVLDEAT